MAKYKVKHTSILHNGELFKEGSIIELDEKHAAKLADFIERLPNQSNSKPKTQTAKTNTKTKPETSDTSKDENADGKDGKQDGGVNNDK